MRYGTRQIVALENNTSRWRKAKMKRCCSAFVTLSARGPSPYFARMIRCAKLRLLTMLWGLWFVSALSLQINVQTCATPNYSAHHHTASLAAHDTSHSANTNHAPSTPDNTTCDSWCCCVATMAAPSATFELQSALHSAHAEPQLDSAPVALTRFAHALPFANGPPAV